MQGLSVLDEATENVPLGRLLRFPVPGFYGLINGDLLL